MTAGVEYEVYIEWVGEFIYKEHWERIDTKFDDTDEKWYYYYRNINTREIYRINAKE